MKPDRRYLVTGGTGTLGRALIKRLYSKGIERLVVVARNESNLVSLKEDYPEIEIVAGNILDPVVAAKACRGIDGIFHLAAFKHATLAEKDVHSCVQSNITGLMNLLHQSMIHHPTFFVFVSTDKAACVKGVYGATKLIGESLVAEMAEANPTTVYSTLRFGNIWASSGSVGEIWKRRMQRGQQVMITDPAATRFFFTADRAASTILDAVGSSGVIIPSMKAVSMGTMLEACQEVYGKSPVIRMGLQPGENLHETIDGVNYSDKVPHFSKDEIIEEFLGGVCRTR